MTEQKVLQESAEHWDRMIRYVEGKNDRTVFPDYYEMKKDIDEYWFADSCPLCSAYENDPAECPKCPLAKAFGPCWSVSNIWFSVRISKTWAEWLLSARTMVKQIRSLLKD